MINPLNQRVFPCTLMADFETDNTDEAIETCKTGVTNYGICYVDDLTKAWLGYSIEEFFSDIRKLGHCKIFFHNLRFDGYFLLNELIRNGWEYVQKIEEKETPTRRVFTCMIDEMRNFFSISYIDFKEDTPFFVMIADSSKLIASSVKAIGKSFKTKYRKTEGWDYSKDHKGTKLTPEEEEYQLNDVRCVAEALQHLHSVGIDKLTIASSALNIYKKSFNYKKEVKVRGEKDKTKTVTKNKFQIYFPQLKEEEINFVMRAYRGGWCYCKPEYKNKMIRGVHGCTLDVNSLYPDVMYNNLFPVGEGFHFDGEYKEDPERPLYIQHIKIDCVLKPKHLPFIQLKGNLRFQENEHVIATNGVEELYVTNIDLDLIKKHYNIIYIEYVSGYKYRALPNLFKPYISYWYEIKSTTTGAMKSIAKLMLNSLYGKFCQKTVCASSIPILKTEDEGIKFELSDPQTRKSVYAPVGIFCTAYARSKTITAAQANYDTFIYSDTDSIHLIDDSDIKGVYIHSKELGAWKLESRWDAGKFIRQKTYMEHITHEDKNEVKPYWNIKCAGMPQKCKERFLEDVENGKHDIDDFGIGLAYPASANIKLRPKSVKGGVLLIGTAFEIKP